MRDKTDTQFVAERVIYRKSDRTYQCHFRDGNGNKHIRESRVLISTLPVTQLLKFFGHGLDLGYRKMRLAYIHVDVERVMEQQWVYFIDRSTLINRLSEFKNFYPVGAYARTRTTVICVEITAIPICSESAVVKELVRLGILDAGDVLDIKLVDLPRAYPVFDMRYEDSMASAKSFLEQYPNLMTHGRQADFVHQDIDEIFGGAKKVARTCMQSLVSGKL